MSAARQSITVRLTLLFAAVSTAVLLILGVVVGQLVERHFEELDLDLLGGKLELIRHALDEVRSPADLAALPARLDAALVGQRGISVDIREADGKTIYASGHADFSAAPKSGSSPLRWAGPHGHDVRGLIETMPVETIGRPLTVGVAIDLMHHQHFMREFDAALWTVVGLAAIISGLLGWAAARKGLAPLRAIGRDAAGITAARLDQRLAADAIPSELAEVAQSLNDMLARLEASFRRLSDFSSDLAHELRTPVSNLLTQTQVTLSRARSIDDYQDVLASNAEEFERLSKMIGDMLFLAKADNDLVVPERAPVDLRAEVEGVAEYYEIVAEDRGIALSLDGQAETCGDRLMLRRAIGNLISNAFQHTPSGGRIAIRLAQTADGHAEIRVENTGDAIPPEHLPRLFDRFYRADPSRHRSEGVGLGLAITRSILRAHGGDATVESADGRTSFALKLPQPATH